MVLRLIRTSWSWLRHVFADGGYACPKLRGALKGKGDWPTEFTKQSDAAQGFEALPRRWVVERTFAWLGRSRRLAKDWEASISSAEAWLLIAHICGIVRRLVRLHAGPTELCVRLSARLCTFSGQVRVQKMPSFAMNVSASSRGMTTPPMSSTSSHLRRCDQYPSRTSSSLPGGFSRAIGASVFGR
jgi:putative transposase